MLRVELSLVERECSNCQLGPNSLWVAHLMEMMIALNSSFREDQIQPKYHLIWTR